MRDVSAAEVSGGKVSVAEADGKTHEFQASKETLQDLKVGDTIEARLRELAGEMYDRSHNPRGILRQMHAISASGDRTASLRKLELPKKNAESELASADKALADAEKERPEDLPAGVGLLADGYSMAEIIRRAAESPAAAD